MSGITGSCIVCGKFHATGHFGDEYVLLQFERGYGPPLLACPNCLPNLPTPQKVVCSVCKEPAGRRFRFPEGTWDADHEGTVICQDCKDAREHKRLHEHMEKIE